MMNYWKPNENIRRRKSLLSLLEHSNIKPKLNSVIDNDELLGIMWKQRKEVKREGRGSKRFCSI
jgi:hypothetical protein